MLVDNRLYLKVKIKSLAVEASIIRKEEKKTKNPYLKHGLNYHRKWDVRREARASLIAYGYIRGLAYSDIEKNSIDKPDIKRVKQLVEKYGLNPVLYYDTGKTDYLVQKKSQTDGLENWLKA